MPNIRMRCGIVRTFGLILLLSEPSQADRLFLRKDTPVPPELVNVASYPDAGPGSEKYYPVRILEYFVSTHLDWQRPEEHDRLVLQAIDKQGRSLGDTFTLSRMNISVITHEFDTMDDFAWHFSDRHILSGAGFGSSKHRQSLYALFDPSGSLEMNKGGGISTDEDITEGRLTKYIMSGLPSMVDYMTGSPWGYSGPTVNTPYGAFENDPSALAGMIGRDRFGPMQLFIASGQARQYGAIDDAVGLVSDEAIRLLCSLAGFNTEFAEPASRIKALRAFEIGIACRNITSVILTKFADAITDGIKPSSRTGIYGYDSIPAVEEKYFVDVALDVVRTEPSFATIPGLTISFNADGRISPRSQGRYWRAGEALVRGLAAIASSEGPSAAPQPMKDKALKALERLILPLTPDGAPAPTKNGPDQVAYQDMLWDWRHNWTDGPAQILWVYKFYCRNGWGWLADSGPSKDYNDHVYNLTRTAYSLLETQDRIWKSSEFRSDPQEYDDGLAKIDAELQEHAALLAFIMQTADAGIAREKVMLDWIGSTIAEAKAQQGYNSFPGSKYERYIFLHEEAMAQSYTCD